MIRLRGLLRKKGLRGERERERGCYSWIWIRWFSIWRHRKWAHFLSTWICPFWACWLSCRRRGRRYPACWPFSRAAHAWGPNHPRTSWAGWADGGGRVWCPSTVWSECQIVRGPWSQRAGRFPPSWLKVYAPHCYLSSPKPESHTKTRSCWQCGT